jgi:hypothetical protein
MELRGYGMGYGAWGVGREAYGGERRAKDMIENLMQNIMNE